MNLYDLNQAYYLWEDIKEIIDRIGTLYTIEKVNGQRFIKSITETPETTIFSKENEVIFNQLVPKIKSLHKDMYSLIEAITKHKNNGEFNIHMLADRYYNFDEFRHLNNKFKHFDTRGVTITLTSLIMMENNKNIIDVYCNFTKGDGSFKAIRYPDFIETFLAFLVNYELITFND
ncbi:MAG: hypothetical protein BGO87_07420 [Flavobacteriia bacterium 40-80]|uniref:hypothetical protein n=1 Tax=uncultured Flavobacterium sp. TaxID=165435 RepID=UPI0009685A9B|nr:hypothetical protein [uncultured Flavobacterium sp.]OJX36275.1 MAG: hypothetical protein BGO87_07420 [Flavobacteriia bacterium 40-80]HRP37019.1 hypothetical protein [Candidatus Dojkabacteria bacterium]